jgi:hypothetical protein
MPDASGTLQGGQGRWPTPRRLKGLVGETLVVPAAESAEHHETHGEESARLKNQAEDLHLEQFDP